MGEINVVQRMVDVNAILGGEGNGGVIDPRVGFVRDSFVGMAMVLDLLAATERRLSSLVAGLPHLQWSRTSFRSAQQSTGAGGPGGASGGIAAIWDRLRTRGPMRRPIAATDFAWSGDDRWVHVRASNTEPIVRVIAEAADRPGP